MSPVNPRTRAQSVFQLRIQLNGIYPVIWRRVLVPGAIRMAKLSDILIIAMGWSNSHLHDFHVGNKHYGTATDDLGDVMNQIDDGDVTVLEVLREERRFLFDYDFGDGWEHEVVIETVSWIHLGLKYAVCLDGNFACPPEDVGGIHGYANFLDAVTNPNHEEHSDWLEWVGGSFDPTKFALAEVNAALQKVR